MKAKDLALVTSPTEAVIHFRTPYNCADPVKESDKTGLKCDDPTLAQQHFKDQCDINILFGKYLETGEMPQVMEGLSYGNFEGIFDFQTAMNAVRTAEGTFQQLPARIKNRFGNDPQKLLEFLNDPENREEAEFLQLVNRAEAQLPTSPTVGTQPTGPAKPDTQDPAAKRDSGGGATATAPQQ